MLDTPLANRLRKNHRHLKKWARRTGVHAYRIYDHDLPEQPFAVDLYDDHVLAQEYERAVPLADADHAAWLKSVRATLCEVLETTDDNLLLKVRRRQSDGTQYEKLCDRRVELIVVEGGHRFAVNLSDHLDTGLFLDHRLTRAMVGALASGKRFLNLFAYTASFTVYAARGGAAATTSVDLSNTYLAWAERNFALNAIGGTRHRLIRGDAREFLDAAGARRERYDLIVIDPPTYSKSKMAPSDFDVQRDHAELLAGACALLDPGGTVVFSTNFRKFRLDADRLAGVAVRDITARTIPPDFRDARIHRCYLLSRP